MQNIFLEITVIICLAAVLSVIFRFLKQPIILAYILTGIIIGHLGFFPVRNSDVLQALSDIGITFLLFLMGLEIKIKEFPLLGKTALLVGAGQMIFTFLLGYLISFFFGFDQTTSFFVTIALVFSSTVIGIKLLSDKKDLNSLYGKLAVGILLMQDFLEIAVLIFLSSAGKTDVSPLVMALSVVTKSVILFVSVGYLSFNVFPKIIEKLSGSAEILFLVSIAWLFGFSALISSPMIGFPISIGGFLAGLALTNSMANSHIIAKAKTLRDFFIILFFVVLGINMSFVNISEIIFPAIIMSAFVLIIKPLIIMICLGILGYRKRTSFMAGTVLAQISEFSLIIIFLASKSFDLSDKIVSLITLVGVISFTLSSYMVINNNKFYLKFSRFLSIFEKKNTHEEIINSSSENMDNLKEHIVIVGGDQMGQSVLDSLESSGKEVVVIDFNPSIVKKIGERKEVHRLFGDIGDLDIQEKAKLDTANLVLSTVPDIEDNVLLLRELKHNNKKAKVIVMAFDKLEARILYKEGADYVVLPHLAGGRQLAKILENDLENLSELRARDQRYL